MLFFWRRLGALAAEIPLDQRQPDTAFVSADTRALQNDDTANPGMLAVLDGEALWNEKAGTSNKSCADCHGDAATSMKGVAARYPAFDPAQNKPLDLEQRINLSRVNDQKAPALKFESKELLALTMYIGMQSRGMPVAIEENAQNKPFIEAGRALFEQRRGTARTVLRAVPRRQLGQETCRQSDPASASHRLSDLPVGVAGSRFAATAVARLHERGPRRAL